MQHLSHVDDNTSGSSTSFIPSDSVYPSSSSNSSPSHSPLVPVGEVRGSNRHRQAPSYFQDYECRINSITSPYSLDSVLSYELLPLNHKYFVMSLGLIKEPKYDHQVVKHPEWQKAMQLELRALEQNHN